VDWGWNLYSVMAHFAKLDDENTVIAVHAVNNDVLLVDGVESEARGIVFLNKIHNTSDNWKQTSYNTQAGVHLLGGTPFRKNYAGKEYTYDESRDAFISPKPYESWVLNEDTCTWEPPVPRPEDASDTPPYKAYFWNEEITSWQEQTPETHPELEWPRV